MSRNGSGTYALASGNPVVTGTSISSTWANNTLNDLASAVTQSISNDGQTPITANLPMTGFKHTNVANATARTEYCAAGQAQDNTFDWLTSVAGTDTITASAAIGLASYAAGQTFRFVAAGANTTTSVTLNLNSLGAKAVTKNGATALAVGDIPSGCVVEVVYDGTRFQLVGVAVNHAATADSATSATSATTATNATNVTGTIASGVTATTQAAGDNTTKVATTAFMTGAFTGTNQSLAASGYQKLPGGLIIQWGYAANPGASTNTTVTFGTAFPTACTAGFAVGIALAGANPVSMTSLSTTGMVYDSAANSATKYATYWLALGY